MIKKKEIFIFALILLVLLTASVLSIILKTDGSTVEITANGSRLTYPLGENKLIELEKNTIIIENGEVYVSHADCPNQICVKTGRISKVGEQIACLPNRVLVEIKK